MDAFIYCADTYCPDCTAKIKAELDAAGKTPATPDNESSYDSDEYPKGPYQNGGGEADMPQHCAECHIPLENDLTADGVNYVAAALREYVEGTGGAADVLDGWAEQLSAYSMDENPKFALDAYNRVRALEKGVQSTLAVLKVIDFSPLPGVYDTIPFAKLEELVTG